MRSYFIERQIIRAKSLQMSLSFQALLSLAILCSFVVAREEARRTTDVLYIYIYTADAQSFVTRQSR